MRIRRAFFIGVFLCVGFAAVSAASGCSSFRPPPTVITSAGRAAFVADQLVQQFGRFQNVIIDLSRMGRIKTEDARLIVLWISGDSTATPPQTGLLKAIVDHPNEWKPAARVTWATFRPKLAAIPEVAVWLPIVDDLLGGA